MTTSAAQQNLLTPYQAAERLGVTRLTLANWRCTSRYDLPFVKIGRAIRYKPESIQAFIEKRTRGQG
ncbi:MAG: helix-turn-helix domain-containing protein [Magnetococcales bacterium]|nr:helix-turn-helix domain-containing protein [Magnetococcales bacterium]